MKAFRGSQPLQPVVKVYGLLSLQDLLDRVPSGWNTALRTPLPKCGTVHMGRVPVTVAIPNEVRGA